MDKSTKDREFSNHESDRVVVMDWRHPLLCQAAPWLLKQFGSGDLRANETLVVLPTRRAVDELQAMMREAARADGVQPTAVEVMTTGDLVGRCVQPDVDPASEFEQTLAWSSALADQDAESLAQLLPSLPESGELSTWMEIGHVIGQLHASLAAEAISFEDAASYADGKDEVRRWRVLVQLHQKYLDCLVSAGRVDSDEAALASMDSGHSWRHRDNDKAVVLIGTTDLSPLVRRMLAKREGPVWALIGCSSDLRDGFDSYGAVIASKWLNHHVPLSPSHFVAAEGMADQADAVVETLAHFGKTHSVDQVVVGVTDETQVPLIETKCRLAGGSTFRYMGYTVKESAVGRLLDRILLHLQQRRWRSLASLVRHADVMAMLSDQLKVEDANGWLGELDQVMASCFPRDIDGGLPPQSVHNETVTRVRDIIETWLSPWKSRRRTIVQWARVLASLLEQVDGVRRSRGSAPLDRTSRGFAVAKLVLDDVASVSQSLDQPVNGVAALEMLAARIGRERLSDERPRSRDAANDDRIGVYGWLDLALDTSPAMVLCGLNHPFVPESVSGDPFLPRSLRLTLLQSANDRRYARDVVALHQMIASRPSIRFVVGSHAADGSPTPPSRLISAQPANDAAETVLHLLTQKRPAVKVMQHIDHEAYPVESSLDDWANPPPVEPHPAISVMSVTAFSDYLTCPYRFYLRHVLKMRPIDDSAMELAANQFGDMVHGALEWFGRGDDKDEADPRRIEDALITALDAYAAQVYGENASATVAIQVRQARRRLRTVAQRQAERVAAGWRIHAVEASVDESDVDSETGRPKPPTGITVDGKFMGLRGRFDRIDYHPDSGRWAILDYKTHGHPPEKKHLKKHSDGSTQWVDLQLPLYRRFIPDLGIPANPDEVELGYFNVAEKDSETKINLASFTPQQFDDANEQIEWCVRAVQAGQFEPTTDTVLYDDYEWLMNRRASPHTEAASMTAVSESHS